MVRMRAAIPAYSALSLVWAVFVFLTLAAGTCAGDTPESKKCFGCHTAIYQTYQSTGMGKSFARPRPENTVEDYTRNNKFFHKASNTWFEMVRRGGDYYQRRYQMGYDGKPANLDETKIDYVLGSALHARAYLHRTKGGGLVQLPVVWYSDKGGFWGMAPGYDSAEQIYEQRPVTYDCVFCHNGYENVPANHSRLGDEPVHAAEMPEGIDCARCHGPGDRHMAGSKPGPIVNPAKLSPERQAEVCYQCHLQSTGFSLPHAVKRYERGDFSYVPGEPLADYQIAFQWKGGTERDGWYQNVSTATRMMMSQCFLKSGGKMNCTTCHDPHDVQHGKQADARYNAICRDCHSGAFTALVAAKKHTAETGCVACHMPRRRPIEVVHIVKTDHYIQRVPPVGLLEEKPEFHETAANAYRGPVELFYPKSLPATPENEMYLAVAQVRDKSNLAEGIPRLARALEVLKPRTPEPYYELAAAYQAAGQPDEAISVYRTSLKMDPAYPAYPASLLGLATAFRQSGQMVQAALAFEAATKASPENAKAWNELGQVEIDLGRAPEALAALRKAMEVGPELPQPHNGLGILLAQSGDFAGGVAEFREAIRILPNYGEAHGNLAGVLDLQHDLAQALYEFELAVKLNPDDASAHFNYGAVLSREKRWDDARGQMREAVRANPSFAEAHEMLGRIAEQAGDSEGALREYSEAVRIRPDLSQAQLDLGAVLAKKGDLAGAREHLTQASGSADATLRGIALQLLNELGGGR